VSWATVLEQHGGAAALHAFLAAAAARLAQDATAARLRLPLAAPLLESRLCYACSRCAQDGRLADAVLLLRKLAAGDASVLSTTRLLSECHDADSYGSRRMIAQHAAQHAARRRDAY
jgi:hypothetical protein